MTDPDDDIETIDEHVGDEAAEGSSANRDYEVGYGKPPRQHQFPKGRSGNPKGRARGARGLKTDFKAELNAKVNITENGKTLRRTKQQVILKSLAAKAAKGDVRAIEQVVSMTISMFGIEDERAGKAGLSPSELAIMESYLAGDVGQLRLPAPDDDLASNTPEPQADSNGNNNINNNGGDTCLPDEESDNDPAR